MATAYISPFARMARRILIQERRASVKDVAASLGISTGALHNRLNGRAHFTPDEISRLMLDLNDTRLADCLLRPAGFVAIRPPPPDSRHLSRRAEDAGLDCIAQVAAALRAIAEGAGGTCPRGARRDEIEAHIENGQRALASMRLTLNAGPAIAATAA